MIDYRVWLLEHELMFGAIGGFVTCLFVMWVWGWWSNRNCIVFVVDDGVDEDDLECFVNKMKWISE